MPMQSLARRISLPLCLLAACASPLAGQFGIAARASTLGLGLEASYRVNPTVGLRAGLNYLEFTREATIEGIEYDATPHFESGTALLDLFPTRGSFHLTAGLMVNRNEGRLVARLAQPITVGNQTYTPQEVGSLVGTVDFRKTAPYVGIGFAGNGRVSFLFDLGVGITGTPRVDLVGTTNLTGAAKAQFDANVQSELAQVRADIEDRDYLKFHPVLAIGLRVRF